MTRTPIGGDGYVVVAEFVVLDDQVTAFIALMQRHAALSQAEPGCQIFEVTQNTADRCKFLLFERYVDARAYEDHRATPHYARFRDQAPAMLQRSDGEIFNRRGVFRPIA